MMQRSLAILLDALDRLAGLIAPAQPQRLPVRIRTDDQRTPPHER
jgi:hypothetical protein